MSDDANSNEDQSLPEEACRAMLAYLHWQEETGRRDFREFLREQPEFAPWEDILRDHGNDVAQMWPQLAETEPGVEGPGFSAKPAASVVSAIPNEVVIETHIHDIQYYKEGGLGVVCKGSDELNRTVAVKFIQPVQEMHAESRKDFLLEREITGLLEHPGVVPMHGIGQTEDGKLYYIMQYIEGATLDKEIDKCHKEAQTSGEHVVLFRNLLAHFVSICQTIAYAHSRGILHRDIKPKNVILGKYGETFVVDWGLAIPVQAEKQHRVEGETTIKPESGDSPQNASGAGTYAYMSPEQALPGGKLTTAADVYSLGATLYHLVCGRPPTRPAAQENNQDVVRRIVAQDFPRPRDVREDISPDLEAICLKAMSGEATERYPNAMELAHDVELYLADEPVSVLPDNITRRMARWRRHHPVAVQVGVLSLLLMLAIAGASAFVSWRWYLEAENQREAAVRQKTSTLLRSAELAAVRWTTDMSLRWRILRHWADDPHLHQGIDRLTVLDDEQIKTAEDVQEWLDFQVRNNDLEDVTVTNWYVNDVNGRLLARHEDMPELRGIRYDFRSYFNGQPNDQPRSDPPRSRPYPPLTVPNLSAIYKSDGSRMFRVALSVPVQFQNETIGVLTMTVDLGWLHQADLIDMRENEFGGKHSPGIQGIYLNQMTNNDANASDLLRVEDDLLEQLRDHFAESKRAFWTQDYSNPLKPGMAPHPAAFAPVMINGKWSELVAVVEQSVDKPSIP